MDKFKLFRDPVHGYISIPKDYCDSFIDTRIFQRLRRIEQTSARVLYPSAHHDRFAHSLGVFHIGYLTIEALKKSSKNKLLSENLEKSFLIACLLHDCGHSPFSHTFENYYINWKENEVTSRLVSLIHEDNEFENDFKECKPSPHEIISSIVACEEYGEKIYDLSGDKGLIARMITGCYFKSNNKQLENCMIGLLNGRAIDVDKLDYIMRDSWASGTNNVRIDITRLLSSILIRKDTQGIYKVFFQKRALNVIKNIIDGRNFLYQWIYNHHKVIYEQYLIKTSVTKVTEIICPDSENFLKKIFSLESFFDQVKFKEYSFFLPNDGDVLYLLKQYQSDIEEVEELLSRRYRRKALWKTHAEFIHYFSDIDEKNVMKIRSTAKEILLDFFNSNGIMEEPVIEVIKPKTIFIRDDQVLIDIDGNDVLYPSLFPKDGRPLGLHYFIPYIPLTALSHRGSLIEILHDSIV